jgi:hypothetical protein
MYSTPFVLLYRFRSKSHLVNQSSLPANIGSDASDEEVMEAILHIRERRDDSELNCKLS